jgi:hypothetical protein
MTNGADASSLVLRRSTISNLFRVVSDRAIRGSWPCRASYLVAALWLGVLSIAFFASLSRFPYYSPFASVEEMTLMYTSAGNFITYGFSNSGFLQDFSTSSNAADHPYVYNHMPPGPEITVALLLKASSESYRVVRVAFWLLFLVGMLCYFRFAGLVLSSIGLCGAGCTVLFFNPLIALRVLDDPLYAPFPLLAFLPLLLLEIYYRTSLRRYFYATFGVVFVSSVYLDYLSMVVVVCCWIFLSLTRLLRTDRSHLLIFLGVVACGIATHLFQNLLYLGPDLFSRELLITLTNRTVGVPAKAALKEFYEQLGMVHHGSTPIIASALISNIWHGFWFPGRSKLLLVGIVSLVAVGAADAWRYRQSDLARSRGDMSAALGFFGRLVIWVSGTLVFSMLSFPAFTQEYGLHGVGLNAYFVAIVATALFFYAIRTAVRLWHGAIPRTAAECGRVALGLVLIYLAGAAGWRAVQFGMYRLLDAETEYRQFRYAAMEDLRRLFSGQVYMTNINPVAVGFFVREAGYGVCELASLPPDGDVDATKCHVAYMKRRDHYQNIRPRYFFFFKALFPGFAECLPSKILPSLGRGGDACIDLMQQRLANRFAKVHENDLFTVFDLHSVK